MGIMMSPYRLCLAIARPRLRPQLRIQRSISGLAYSIVSRTTRRRENTEIDPLNLPKADICSARGKALLVETTVARWNKCRGVAL